MEPFRPIIDKTVFDWCKTIPQEEAGIFFVTPSFKQTIHAAVNEKIIYAHETHPPVADIMDFVVKGFRLALTSKSVKSYKPWTRKNSKWAG